MRSIDLNADVGEGLDDGPLLALVSSANVACGAHAGDLETMWRTVEAAAALGLAIGAHPGYADPASFGRTPRKVPPQMVEDLVESQVRLLVEVASKHGVRVSHVKPHGALYNQAAAEPVLARAIARAVRAVDPSLRLVGLAGSALPAQGAELKLPVAEEGFADRRYLADGSLTPRSRKDALIQDPMEAGAQALAIARAEPFGSVDGKAITVRADTICLHGDTPGAVANARAVRRALEDAGIEVRALERAAGDP